MRGSDGCCSAPYYRNRVAYPPIGDTDRGMWMRIIQSFGRLGASIVLVVCFVQGCDSRTPGSQAEYRTAPDEQAIVSTDIAPVWSRQYWGVHLGECIRDVGERYTVMRVRDSSWDFPDCECWRIDSEPSGVLLGSVFAQAHNDRIVYLSRMEKVSSMYEAAAMIDEERSSYRISREDREYDPPRIHFVTSVDGRTIHVSVNTTHRETGEIIVHKAYSLPLPRKAQRKTVPSADQGKP